MATIHVQTSGGSYPVVLRERLLPDLAQQLTECGVAPETRLVFVSTPEVWSLWSADALRSFPADRQPAVLLLPSGERHKRLSTVERLAESLAAHHADRDTVLLALGGGVVGDITGFLAAIYMRGVRYVHLPTTVLAQVDSSIGGKTGVNLRSAKNLVGSFHQPLAVFTDISTLRTLPSRELRAGMQEAIKSGLLGSPELFATVEGASAVLLDPSHPMHLNTLAEVIAASIRVKAAIVAADEREAGTRMLLNLGHTLGHAIEAATHFRGLLHGEAVGWGMIAALHLARERGVLKAEDTARAQSVIQAFGPLPRFRASAQQLVSLTTSDKKRRSGVLSFVLPVALGQATVVHDVSEAEMLAAAQSMLNVVRRAPPRLGAEPPGATT